MERFLFGVQQCERVISPHNALKGLSGVVTPHKGTAEKEIEHDGVDEYIEKQLDKKLSHGGYK